MSRIGVMEYWNEGSKRRNSSVFHYSAIPFFQDAFGVAL